MSRSALMGMVGLLFALHCGSGTVASKAAPAAPHEQRAETTPTATPTADAPADEIAPVATDVAPAAATAPNKTDPSKPRVYSIGYTSWIRKKPEVKEGDFLGYVRPGSSVSLRSPDKIRGEGCPGGFYQVEPRGYLCGDRTVTNKPPETFKKAADATHGSSGPFPYRYALSDGAPMYNRIPTKKEQERYEPKWATQPYVFHKMPKTLHSHEELADGPKVEATDEIPDFLRDGGSAKEGVYDLVEQTIPLGSMLSFTKAFKAEGRIWLLSADHTIVPADRVRPFRPSTFKGVDLKKGEAKLPLAWMRVKARPQYRKKGDSFELTGKSWPVRSWVEVTDTRVKTGQGKSAVEYIETRQSDDQGTLYVAASDATVVERLTERATGVKEKQKWFSIRLTQGTLVAYEDLEPVYTTLVSPGSGGVPIKGRDNVKYSTTPTGSYSITFKDRAATMSPETGKNRSFWIQDVPHTMYFDAPFALHAAFWHERFGEYVSAGCVNLSPIDAERMFAWADPPVPDEWQGAAGAGTKENGGSTIVAVRK